MFPIKVGGSIDPADLGERLASYGYLRVPRVFLPGEFALRGEVLDLYMPGDDEAIRVTFDFDEVGKNLPPLTPAGQKALQGQDRVIVRPMKEMVWTPERVEALAAQEGRLPNCAGRMGSPPGGASGKRARPRARSSGTPWPGTSLLPCWTTWRPRTARASRRARPEPQARPDKPDMDFFFFFLTTSASRPRRRRAAREYAGLYRGALKEAPVPPPERLLFCFRRA